MLALSIRQPYAEEILRGTKRIEYRTRATKIIGERFYIYASKGKLPVASCQLPEGKELPRGVIVGTAVISRCQPTTNNSQPTTLYEWHLTDVKRLARPRKPKRQPQPVWFRPF